ncbi:MAG: hypothetical protein DMG58_23540 [Acidobacteria bacterium]|nr:MAG: hypothetical protein DMG58_23540 [Acidobacteriota bacterium]
MSNDTQKKHIKYVADMIAAGLLADCGCDICQPKIEPPKIEFTALEAQIKKRLAELAGTLPSEAEIRQNIQTLDEQKREWQKLLIVVDVARPFANRIETQAGRVLAALTEADRMTPSFALKAMRIVLDEIRPEVKQR